MKYSVPALTIGIITYNNPIDQIKRCLQSIYTQHYAIDKIELIIRNQGNPQDIKDIEELIQSENLSNITIYQGKNIGFGEGHNDIFSRRSPQSNAYLCMNPDGFLHPDGLSKLIEMAEINKWQGIFEAIQEPIMHPKYFHPKTGLTEWCSGACVLIPVEIYEEINGFDGDFFLYCEDVDLSWRVKAAGYHCFTCYNALFFHYAMDRASRECEIWKSATILAHKWRSFTFKKQAIERLKQYIDLHDDDIQALLNNIQPHSLKDVLKANPNFNNSLNFAKKMWK